MLKNIFLILLFSVPAIAGAAPSVSKTSGPAPLYVHCWGDTEASDGSGTDPYLDYEFRWSVDSDMGDWGTDDKPKNICYGPSGGFVFETAGTYTITLRVLDSSGNSVSAAGDGAEFEITVSDPDTYFASTATTCVAESGDSDFTGCPSGANNVSTNDLTTLSGYADSGERILFKRGGEWTLSSDLSWTNNTGIVQFGAFGTGTNPNDQGIYDNNPIINNAGYDFIDKDGKQHWRVMDISFNGGPPLGGEDFDFADILQLRLKVVPAASGTGIGWSHWNTVNLVTIDHMAVVDCYVDGDGVSLYNYYIGGERIFIAGNVGTGNLNEGGSHVMRCWQLYKGIIAHNNLSGSGYPTGLYYSGRPALKLHSPEESVEHCTPTAATACLENRTQFGVVSDNIIGGSAPVPMTIAPQDAGNDERISDMLVERNFYAGDDYGENQRTNLQYILSYKGTYGRIANNVGVVIDSTYDYFYGVSVETTASLGVDPTGVRVYNNTYYTAGTASTAAYAVHFVDGTNHQAYNNLLSAPNATGSVSAIYDDTSASTGTNLELDDPDFVDPDNVSPLSRDLSVAVTSTSVIGQGTTIALWDTFDNLRRIGEVYDIGAFQYGADEDGSGGNENQPTSAPFVPILNGGKLSIILKSSDGNHKVIIQ